MGAYQSLLFLGLEIVICVGSTLTLPSWIIEPTSRARGSGGGRTETTNTIIALQLQQMALTGEGYGDVWKHRFDEVPRNDEGRFVSATDEAGDGSSGRGRLLLWECDATACGDREEGIAVHGQDPETQHVKSSPLSALSWPTNSGAEESQQRLVLQGHGGPVPWKWPRPGAGFRDQQGGRDSVELCSDLGDEELDF
jgi:hypothetical protein